MERPQGETRECLSTYIAGLHRQARSRRTPAEHEALRSKTGIQKRLLRVALDDRAVVLIVVELKTPEREVASDWCHV